MMHCRGRIKLAVNVWQSEKNPKTLGIIVFDCVSLSVCFSVPLLECVFREVGGYELLYIHGERLGGAVQSWLSQDGSAGSGSGGWGAHL